MTPSTSASGPGSLTQAIYNASLPPAVLALINGAQAGPFAGIPYAWLTDPSWIGNAGGQVTPQAAAQAKALLTAAQLTGWSLDFMCQLSRWPAPTVMQVRQNDGYAAVPPYGTPNVNVGPGLPPPAGETSNYPSTIPSTWIKVSTDASDYPPYSSPVVPTAPTAWQVNTSEMLSWTTQPKLNNGVITPGSTQYYFAPIAGQMPPIGTTCVFDGSAFVAAYYPNPEAIGGMITMWLLVGAATPAV